MLIKALCDYHDELEADFQQYYNLDIASVPITRASRLMSQLPRESRVFRKYEPSCEWGWQESLLNRACHTLDIIAWLNSKDGKTGRNRPKLYEPPFMRRKSLPNEDIKPMDIDEIKKLLFMRRK